MRSAALAAAEELGSPHLIGTTAAIVARSLVDLAPDVASAARQVAASSREPLRAYAPRGTVPAS